MNAPRVSLVLACRNVGSFIDAAIGSARQQTLADIEILVVDDGSSDDTRARALAHAAADTRVVVLNGPGRGPGAARNVALAAAQGEWVAILDGDDFMHPQRLALLLDAAERDGADIVADNLLSFHEKPSREAPGLLLPTPEWAAARHVDLATYAACNALFSDQPPLGYLKPVLRRELLAACRYDETLRIGEDYDLVARLLGAGASFLYTPQPLYFYRRHRQSTSYRMATSDIASLIAADAGFSPAGPVVQAALNQRRRSLQRALHFSQALDSLQGGRWLGCLARLARHPAAVPLMAQSMRGAVSRRLGDYRQRKAGPPPADEPTGKTLLLWHGDRAAATPILAGKPEAVLVAAPRGLRAATPALLLAIARQGPAARILYDDPAALDLVPYALSPAARSELVAVPAEPLAPAFASGAVAG